MSVNRARFDMLKNWSNQADIFIEIGNNIAFFWSVSVFFVATIFDHESISLLFQVRMPDEELAVSPSRKLGKRMMPTCLMHRDRLNISADKLGR